MERYFAIVFIIITGVLSRRFIINNPIITTYPINDVVANFVALALIAIAVFMLLGD